MIQRMRRCGNGGGGGGGGGGYGGGRFGWFVVRRSGMTSGGLAIRSLAFWASKQATAEQGDTRTRQGKARQGRSRQGKDVGVG